MASALYHGLKSNDNESSGSGASGIPASKPRFRLLDIAVFSLSIGCCAIALATVHVENVAWELGYQYQLVVVGLVLSVMNMCLGYAVPLLLLVFEARFGSSSLQNYDGILRNTYFGPQMDIFWRLVLLVVAILPLGLSAAYKTFSGGIAIHAKTTNSTIYYGLFAPPGMKPLGQNTGVSLMFNATLPFIQSTIVGGESYATELPDFPRAYGLNSLLLSTSSAASLDIPDPDFIREVQSQLQADEYWNVTASVLATVTRQNHTVNQSRKDANFWSRYTGNNQYRPTVTSVYNLHSIGLLSSGFNYDQTWSFISFMDTPTVTEIWNMSMFESGAYMFSTQREPCTGTWSITRSSVQLVDGSCSPTSQASTLSSDIQAIYANNYLLLQAWYLPTFVEYLGPFTTNSSNPWKIPATCLSVASMLWSRVTALDGPDDTKPGRIWKFAIDDQGKTIPMENPGMYYPARSLQEIVSSRHTLRQSPFLDLVLVLQPVLLAIVLAISIVLYAVPIDRGFGMVSILAGIDRDSLECLKGAALSAKLSEKVGLDIAIHEGKEKHGEVRYTLVQRASTLEARLRPGQLYG